MPRTNIRGSQIADGTDGVDLTVDVTGLLPLLNGGTGAADAATARTNLGLGNVDNTSDATKNSAAAALTNKHILTRVSTQTTNIFVVPVIDVDSYDYFILNHTGNLTMNAPTGTPAVGDKIWINIITGVGFIIQSWNAAYESVGINPALPASSTAATNVLYEFYWTGTKWRRSDIGYVPGGTDVPVADGGTGASTLTGILKGNGTSAFTAATAGTDYYNPGGTDVAVVDGGTGRSTSTTAYGLIAAGTTATGAHQTISPGTSGQFLKSGGAAALGAFATIAESDITNLVTDLAAKAPLASPTFTGTVAGITKSMVGLGSADNTSDATKDAAATTLTNKTLTSPKINQILDANGNIILATNPQTSAANYIGIQNEPGSGGVPRFYSAGADTNIDLAFGAAGSGAMKILDTNNDGAIDLMASGVGATVDFWLSAKGGAGKVYINSVDSSTFYRSGSTDVAVADGGTGRSTSTTAYGLLAAGTTATGAHQTLAAGATTEMLVGGGAAALPAWTTATGSGAPVRATSPTLVTPALGTPSAVVLTNGTGLVATTGLTATGTKDSTTYLRGDNTWATPAGGGGAINAYATSIGNGSATSINVNHALATSNVIVACYDHATHKRVRADLTVTDANNINLVFATAPSTGGIDVVVSGSAAITTGVADGSVTQAKLANGAVGTAQLNVTGTPDGTKFLRDDMVWAPGGGDTSTSASSSVDSEVALFNSTTGKLLKRASGTGIAVLTSGVLSTVAAPAGTILGTTDTQTVTNKTFNIANNDVVGLPWSSEQVMTIAANYSDMVGGVSVEPGPAATGIEIDSVWVRISDLSATNTGGSLAVAIYSGTATTEGTLVTTVTLAISDNNQIGVLGTPYACAANAVLRAKITVGSSTTTGTLNVQYRGRYVA